MNPKIPQTWRLCAVSGASAANNDATANKKIPSAMMNLQTADQKEAMAQPIAVAGMRQQERLLRTGQAQTEVPRCSHKQGQE